MNKQTHRQPLRRNAEIDDFHREIELTRKNKQLMKFLEHRAKQTKTVSAAEARVRLGLAKK